MFLILLSFKWCKKFVRRVIKYNLDIENNDEDDDNPETFQQQRIYHHNLPLNPNGYQFLQTHSSPLTSSYTSNRHENLVNQSQPATLNSPQAATWNTQQVNPSNTNQVAPITTPQAATWNQNQVNLSNTPQGASLNTPQVNNWNTPPMAPISTTHQSSLNPAQGTPNTTMLHQLNNTPTIPNTRKRGRKLNFNL